MPRGSEEATLIQASVTASRLLQPEALEVRRRKPLLDGELPEVADVDLVAIWEKREERPERTVVEAPGRRVFVDILWIPASALLDPIEGAGYMMLPHLLSESERLWSRSSAIGSMIENIERGMHERPAWERRIGEQMGFGDAALHEASSNLGFPPAAVFFLQVAHAYYLTALADSLERSVMSLQTKPVAKARLMAEETGIPLETMMRSNLHLDRDPSPSLGALGRVHEAVSARGSPRAVRGLGERTRGHYLYSISPLELEYRTAVASAFLDRLDYASANFYLRFWAYSLSRCPVVLEDARQGRTTSFYVPFMPLEESLRAACPEILDDVRTVFGEEITVEQARESIRGTNAFRGLVTEQIGRVGLHPRTAKAA